jgi:hypothetical protein
MKIVPEGVGIVCYTVRFGSENTVLHGVLNRSRVQGGVCCLAGTSGVHG